MLGKRTLTLNIYILAIILFIFLAIFASKEVFVRPPAYFKGIELIGGFQEKDDVYFVNPSTLTYLEITIPENGSSDILSTIRIRDNHGNDSLLLRNNIFPQNGKIRAGPLLFPDYKDYQITVDLRDEQESILNRKLFLIIADDSNPELKMEVEPPYIDHTGLRYISASVPLRIAAVDELSGIDWITFSYDESPLYDYSPMTGFHIVENGLHRVFASASDNVGNTGYMPSEEIYVDAIDPEVGIATQLPIYRFHGTNRTLITNMYSIFAKDEQSGLRSAEINIDDTGWMPYSAPFQIPTRGRHSIKVRAEDNVGNIGEKELVLYIDTGLPYVPGMTYVEPEMPPDWYDDYYYPEDDVPPEIERLRNPPPTPGIITFPPFYRRIPLPPRVTMIPPTPTPSPTREPTVLPTEPTPESTPEPTRVIPTPTSPTTMPEPTPTQPTPVIPPTVLPPTVLPSPTTIVPVPTPPTPLVPTAVTPTPPVATPTPTPPPVTEIPTIPETTPVPTEYYEPGPDTPPPTEDPPDNIPGENGIGIPQLYSPENNSVSIYTRPNFSWWVVEEAIAYEFQIADNVSFMGTSMYFHPSHRETTSRSRWRRYEVLPLPSSIDDLSERSYYWRVRTIIPSGQKSDWSEIYRFEIVRLAIPVFIEPVHNTSVPASGKIAFRWYPVQGADKYRFQISTSSSWNEDGTRTLRSAQTYSSDDTSFDYNVELKQNTIYYYRIRSEHEDVSSQWSEVFIVGYTGDDMVFCPQVFQSAMGSPDGFEDEQYIHFIDLSPFFIDKYETTISEYADFLSDVEAYDNGRWTREMADGSICGIVREGSPGSYEYFILPGRDDYPVSYVNWYNALDYALWKDKMLPTEAQWEYAAKGRDIQAYPWGNTVPDENPELYCNFLGSNFSRVVKVGEFSAGKSRFGAYDMSGNVSEWVMDWYDEDAYRYHSTRNPTGPLSGELKVLRGGAYRNNTVGVRATVRYNFHPSTKNSTTGIRCIRSN